jgi:hypothetical protein
MGLKVGVRTDVTAEAASSNRTNNNGSSDK